MLSTAIYWKLFLLLSSLPWILADCVSCFKRWLMKLPFTSTWALPKIVKILESKMHVQEISHSNWLNLVHSYCGLSQVITAHYVTEHLSASLFLWWWQKQN